jgi:hypothetical protein
MLRTSSKSGKSRVTAHYLVVMEKGVCQLHESASSRMKGTQTESDLHTVFTFLWS